MSFRSLSNLFAGLAKHIGARSQPGIAIVAALAMLALAGLSPKAHLVPGSALRRERAKAHASGDWARSALVGIPGRPRGEATASGGPLEQGGPQRAVFAGALLAMLGGIVWSAWRSRAPIGAMASRGEIAVAPARIDRSSGRSADPERENLVAQLTAVTRQLEEARVELRQRNDDLRHFAFRDPLTNLANRALFRDRVAEALAGVGDRPQEVAILLVDLDDFSDVNDSLGHATGDRVLLEVAGRLRNATRGSDLVARLDGDVFAILLHRVRKAGEAGVVAQRIIDALRPGIALDDTQVQQRVSIGIAAGRSGISAAEMLRHANVAMNHAKANARGGYEVFAPEMHLQLMHRLDLEKALNDALDRSEFRLHFQPIVDLTTGRVNGFEALLRWHHPTRGLVLPNEFIPLAEERGLIVPIGRWVLGEACRQARMWQRWATGAAPVAVNVNVSASQLENGSFARDVKAALAESSLDPACLVLEITENVLMRDRPATIDQLRDLRRTGSRLAIDDFGTGYSSLALLRRLPVDVLKIDQAFIKSVDTNENDAALVRTIVALGQALELRTVGEGIERQTQCTKLHELGCHQGQGYLFSAAVPASQIPGLLRGSHKAPPTPRA